MEQLFKDLGGNSAIADALNCTPNAVSNWRSRGIPWKQRPAIARMAGERGVMLPKTFWGESAA